MKAAIVSLILLFIFVSTSFAATHDTAFTFSTIETPHFSIHFHQGLDEIARKTAVMTEDVHARMVEEFLWQPAEKTQVVLIDDTDFNNGLAVTIPYNTIYLQVAPPSLASTLGEYDDWLKTLITHEYAHILTSDPARGYWKWTRRIFGKPLPWLGDPFTELMFLVTAPANTFMPRWWHEGMATWSETNFTGEGRGKGSYFEMVFRTAVAENHLPRVDEINGDVPYWPDGDLPYLFGYRLQRYIADTYGKETLGKLSIAHSGRFPYSINTPPQELTGRSYRELYADMLYALKREQSAKIAVLSRAPFTQLTPISSQGENLTHPRFSPDGTRIAFTREDPNDHTTVFITDRTGKKPVAQFRRRYSDGSIAWSPDGSRLFFTQAEINRGYDTYQDLYVYRLSDDSVTRLTYQQRISDVDLSPDGKLFAAIVTSRGSQQLALLDASQQGKSAHPRLLTDYRLQRVSSPHWSPDGKSVCYAVRDNAGQSTIRVHDAGTGEDRALFSASNTLEYPVWSRDGSSIYYISDETGVFNLFAYDLREAKSYQVTHLLTGAWQPDPSPDGSTIALATYTSQGFHIAEVKLDRSMWSATRGPSLPLLRDLPAQKQAQDGTPVPGTTGADGARISSAGNGQAAPPASAASATPAGTAPKVTSYSALHTLYPHFWLPRLSDDGSNKTVVGAFTAGTDVLSYHTYTLAADYSSGRKRGYFDLVYDNDYFYPTLSLLAHIQPFLYSNLEDRGDYWELNQGVTLQASVPVNFLERRFKFKAGYQFLDQKALSELGAASTFNGVPVFEGRRDNVFAGFTFDDLLKYPYSISPEEGRDITLTYRRFARVLGSDQDLTEYSADYHEYLRLPGEALKHHVLYLRLSGALAYGDLQYGQQPFQIGGTPSDLNPYSLRGYPDRFSTGKYVATGTLEYRAPFFDPMRGPGTLPLFLEKVHGAFFVDGGQVWSDRFSGDTNGFKVGAGFEARADITLGYWAKITPALGFAHGFNRGGENQIYFTVYSNL